jgi:thiol-disulfide isomerase/thioredoxin
MRSGRKPGGARARTSRGALFYRALPKRPAAPWLALVPFLLGSGGEPIDLTELDGSTPVSLALAPDRTAVVVHFWATWCPECVAELPALASAARACTGAPVALVAVNVGETAEAIARYREEHPFDLPVLRDPNGKTWRRFARGLPANVIWTAPAGQRTDTGLRTEAEWRTTLAGLGCAPPPRREKP